MLEHHVERRSARKFRFWTACEQDGAEPRKASYACADACTLASPRDRADSRAGGCRGGHRASRPCPYRLAPVTLPSNPRALAAAGPLRGAAVKSTVYPFGKINVLSFMRNSPRPLMCPGATSGGFLHAGRSRRAQRCGCFALWERRFGNRRNRRVSRRVSRCRFPVRPRIGFQRERGQIAPVRSRALRAARVVLLERALTSEAHPAPARTQHR